MLFEKWAEKLKTKNDTEDEIVFKNFEEETASAEPTAKPADNRTDESNAATGSSSIEGSNIELKIVRPAAFDEVGSIADYLIEGCTVVLNMELLDRATTIRMLDFLNGVTYTKDGEIKNVAQNTYLITPSGIDVRD